MHLNMADLCSFLCHPTCCFYWRATERKSQQHSKTKHYWHKSLSHEMSSPANWRAHIQVHNIKVKRCHFFFYPSRIQADIWTLDKKNNKMGRGVIALLTVLYSRGHWAALVEQCINCTLNYTYWNIQFVYECIHG